MYPVSAGFPNIANSPPVPPPGMVYASSFPSAMAAPYPYMAAADYVRFQQPIAVESNYGNPLDVRINYDQFHRLQNTMNSGFASVNKSLGDLYNSLSSIYKYGLPVREY